MHKIEQHIEANWSHLKTNQISVACSGGLDSIVLAFVLHTLNFKVDVIHVNYKLRGEDSELDAQFVEQFCMDNSIPFDKRIVDLKLQLKDGGNLQELARNVRYDWFHEIISANGKVALAHHLDDQVETFFLNLARKSGVMGLACMPNENNGIVRPLLDFSKEDLKEYAEASAIEWREDVSNRDSKYRRNKLRNEILPGLTEAIPTLNSSVIELVKQFQRKQKELEEEVRHRFESSISHKFILLEELNSMTELQYIEFFRQLGQPASIAQEIKRLKQKGTSVNFVASTKTQFDKAVLDGDRLSFVVNSARPMPELIIQKVNELPTVFSKDEVYLDESKIVGKLHFRKWKTGDRMSPIGMNGTRLISDIISDAKINSHLKANLVLLCDDKHIHWCAGLCVGKFAVASSSSTILKCSKKN
ncbi:MAG: tRNA(Ile)-lysidine synthase [Crocinitomicaceae bacterium]|jgi:tRNA(Ile)-lysidine synthase